jgi:hypothetical protein
MNRLTTLEINQFSPKMRVFIKQILCWKPRPKQEEKDPISLDLVGMVSTKGIQWFFPFNEAYLEEECPRRTKEEFTCSLKQMNFSDIIFYCQDYEYVDLTQEKLEEITRIGCRKGQLRALNHLNENTRNESRKKEMPTYEIRKRVIVHPPPDPFSPPREKEDLPQLIKKESREG